MNIHPLRPTCLALLVAALPIACAGTPPAGTHDTAALPRPKSAICADDRQVEVWLDLSVPALAGAQDAPPQERTALQTRIVAQQDEVMASLRGLGAVEVARVQMLRNAIAVRLPCPQVDAARKIPGVRGLRVVRDIPRDPPPPQR